MTDSVSLALAVNRLMPLLQSAECSADILSAELKKLSLDLEASKFSAYALIAETAAAGCHNAQIPLLDIQSATIELCDRLIEAAKTDLPFSFENASPTLMNMLFPEPNLEAASGTTSSYSEDSGAQSQSQCSESHSDSPSIDSATRSATEVGHADNASSDHETPGFAVCPCYDKELLVQFLDEASEHIHRAQDLLLLIEKRPEDSESLSELFRSIHSVKGAAGVCEVNHLIEVAHIAESVLARVTEGRYRLAGSAFTVMLQATDFLSQQLETLERAHRSQQELRYPIAPSILLRCLSLVDTHGKCDPELLAELKSLTAINEDDVAKYTSDSKNPIGNDTLRVDGKKLGQLVDLIGELVITEGFVQRELIECPSKSATSVGMKLRKVVRDVQQLSLKLKVVPIGSLLQKMNRLVRDLSEKLDRPTRLVIRGSDTEIDKTLLECLSDPLVHLIRNSLDHGIESSVQERIAAGKPEVATIEIAAEQSSGSIRITITDDGQGLNRPRIRERAIDRGLISPEVRLSDREIDNLIFLPGFSTADTVSEISGRGVGMDVVRKNVESLRGDIQLRSVPGKGTAIRIDLPLTLSIIDGTVVRVGDRYFIVPTTAIIEQIQFSSTSVNRTLNGELILFRSHLIPARRLGDIVNTEHRIDVQRGQVCMVVEAFGERHALLVDQILGQQPIVIKPLGLVLKSFDLFTGCALLSCGEIAFVLDLNAVCRRIPAKRASNETLEV